MNLKSRKLWVTLITVAILIAKALIPQLEGLDENAIIGAVMAYLIGQGIADHGKEKAKIEHRAFRELDIVE